MGKPKGPPKPIVKTRPTSIARVRARAIALMIVRAKFQAKGTAIAIANAKAKALIRARKSKPRRYRTASVEYDLWRCDLRKGFKKGLFLRRNFHGWDNLRRQKKRKSSDQTKK